jgi:dihydropteroate synthase
LSARVRAVSSESSLPLAPHVHGLPPHLSGLSRCLVMGVVNVTPDSFSDGGAFLDPEAAIGQGMALVRDGADIVDVGGESTRPGAHRVSAAEESRRVLPVVRDLAAAGAVVSIDTMRAEVASAALAAGAAMVNDVSGGRADPAMAAVVRDAGTPFVAMHWRGHSDHMQDLAVYGDVVADVVAELRDGMDRLVEAGVDAEQVVLDPGLGFAKTGAHNWVLLAHLDALRSLGRPLLVGASRKGFLGTLLADADGEPRPTAERDDATAAVSALAAWSGAWGVRVHEVRASVDAVRVVAAVQEQR